MSMCFSVGACRCKEPYGVFFYVNKDCKWACAYSVINNVLNVVLSSTCAVGHVMMHLSWLSSHSVCVFLLCIQVSQVSLTFSHKVV